MEGGRNGSGGEREPKMQSVTSEDEASVEPLAMF